MIDVVIQFGVESHERFIKEIWYDPERKRRLAGAEHRDCLVTALLQGWTSVCSAYAAVQMPMVVGLVRGRQGPWQRYLASPLVAAPLMALVAGAMSLSAPLLSFLGSVPRHCRFIRARRPR